MRVWNEFAIHVPLLPYFPSNLASFVWITAGKVQGESKRRDDYTASRRAGTMHCSVTVSFNMLLAQRVSFDVLPTQRVYPWDCISDGFVLLQDNQYTTDTWWVLMCHQHRLIILNRSLSWTRWIIRLYDCDDTTTKKWPPLPPMCVGLGIRLRRRAERGRRPSSTNDLA